MWIKTINGTETIAAIETTYLDLCPTGNFFFSLSPYYRILNNNNFSISKTNWISTSQKLANCIYLANRRYCLRTH